MRQQVKIALLGCAAAALAAAIAPANATVYDVNRMIDGGSVVGTITTDGAIGTIDPSDFIAWDLMLSGPGSTVTITNNDAGAVVFGQGADITADATHVSFNFSGSDTGFLVFQDGMGLGQHYWCVNSNNSTCNDNESVVPQGFMDPSAQFASRSGIQVIASATGAVPEPGTWALMFLGFAGLGYASLRQSRSRAVSA